jgi:hypothetical protein
MFLAGFDPAAFPGCECVSFSFDRAGREASSCAALPEVLQSTIRKRGAVFRKIMLKQKARAGCRSNHNSSRSSPHPNGFVTIQEMMILDKKIEHVQLLPGATDNNGARHGE